MKYDVSTVLTKYCEICDLSIGSTETKYIKLNTKTQNIFCFVNENLTPFYDREDKKTEGEKSFLF